MGKELDAEIAEKVMRWTLLRDAPTGNRFYADADDERYTVGDSNLIRCWSPSRDISAAMEVVERLKGEYIRVIIEVGPSDPLVEVKRLDADGWYFIAREEASTLPEAICRAALAAVNAPHPNGFPFATTEPAVSATE